MPLYARSQNSKCMSSWEDICVPRAATADQRIAVVVKRSDGQALVRPDVLLDARISRTYDDIAVAEWDVDWLVLIHILLVKPLFQRVRQVANHHCLNTFLSNSRTARHQHGSMMISLGPLRGR